MTTRRIGRPRIDESDVSTTVSLRLPSRKYDALYQRAARAHTSVPEIIRRVLDRDQRRHAANVVDDEEE